MQVGHSTNSAASSSSFTTTTDSANNRSYIPSLIPPGVDPAKVDSKMFYTYVPNTIKTRKRTTPAQLEILEGVFITDKKPNAPRRKDLAKKLKMSPREVQVWFQNRRAKEKKSFSKKDISTTTATAAAAATAVTVASASVGSMTTGASPSSDTAPDVFPDSVPSPSSGTSPLTKIEPQTPEPSPRAPQWQQPTQLPTPPTTDSMDHTTTISAHTIHSPPDASPAAYGQRRSSLPVLSLIPPQDPPLPPQLPSSTLQPHAPSPHSHPSHENHYHLPPSFPSAVLPPHMLHHRRSTSALSQHPYALSVRRSSAAHIDYPPPSGPPPGLAPPHPAPYMRASISEGMDMPGLPASRVTSLGGVATHGSQPHHSARFHPFQSYSRRPNLAHRASVPAIFHATNNNHPHPHQASPAMSMPSFPAPPSNAISLEEQRHSHQHHHQQQGDMFGPTQQQQDAFSWNNPDPFGAGTGAVALAPDAGYSFGLPPAMTPGAVVPASGYEFPERKPSVAASELDAEYFDSGVCRRSAGSVVSLYGAASDTSAGSSAGPYFSDVTSEGQGVDEDDGRRGSCVSTSEMLSRLHVGGGAAGEGGGTSPAGSGSDGYASEHGTVTYPSPTSDTEHVNMGSVCAGQSPVPPHTGGSSELALALHSNESVRYINIDL
ncbi:hypothetical protein B0F90DRAFT_1763023 [Multifurca ochricompacta]|uniref:Homeobox domain-containing protein n=1 Tax=Multifurca ochricompacta TaxID=376703 RepID=A0AAD4QIV1_9AGAM|nr:hypothetical protein B0F90DRAFT_1763023 [Multifurca ochricompacta]